MTGMTDYSAKNTLSYQLGQIAMPSLPSVWLALFTGVGTDAGTGFTEVSGGSYARVQVAGPLTTNAATTTASAVLNFASVPSWIVAGMTVYDGTNGNEIGSVLSVTSTTVTLTANAAHAVASGDTLTFSAFGLPTGTGPSSANNSAQVSFATATASWGTLMAFGLYDAVTGGNLLNWDYLGGFAWLPCTISAASPGVLTAHAHGYSAGDLVIYSTEAGGVAPTFSQSNLTGVLAVVGPTTDTFTVTNGGTAVNTSATGNGMVRKISEQSVPPNIQVIFNASQLTFTQA